MAKQVDWPAVEKLLVDEATKQLAAFGKNHPSATIYGAIFDAEPYDGCSVSLLLNTEEHLLQECGEPVDATDLHRRFLPGAFEHSLALTKSKAFPASAIEALVEADMDDEITDDDGLWATTRKLLDVCCAAAHALESGAFSELARTPSFTIAVTPDASEPGDFSVERYAKFKKAVRAVRSTKATVKSLPNKPPPGR